MRTVNKISFLISISFLVLAIFVSPAGVSAENDSNTSMRPNMPPNMPPPAMRTPNMEGGSSMGMMRKKRYRYRKRTHRFQIIVQGVPWHGDNQKYRFTNIGVIYGYNAGRFELGPQIRLINPGGQDFRAMDINLSGWLEYNFIRNTRREKFVPAVGLSVGYEVENLRRHNLALSGYLSLKYFVASRTGFVFNVNYEYITLFTSMFRQRDMGIWYSLSYVHYFH